MALGGVVTSRHARGDDALPTDEGEPPHDGAPIESTDVEAIVHHRPRRQRGEQGPRIADILNADNGGPKSPRSPGGSRDVEAVRPPEVV